ncbi:hypothetical protein PCANC_24150 [Puccinia coronata f. sp. avenae]|uniref:Uncharacterized protein n=1 Tax=Puccinia coronata f. sp. avenae TaxID=200324 RepID=A0A2N5TY00_9BASI|nr:hypothetical protein PCANC_24150 [Puccinia coronata f. sp. avenae]
MTSDQAPQPTPEATSALVANAPVPPPAATPPSSQQAIWENFAPNKAPSQATFEEFTVKPNDTAAAVPLNPDAPILETKIQQITAEDWRELVETLTHSITSTKRKFKEIGKIPDEEAIKVQTGKIGGSSPATSSAALKAPAKKRAKRSKTTKPVDYLDKDPKND